MEILLVSGRFRVPVVEGTQKSVMNLANELVEKGHEVSWLTREHDRRPGELDEKVELIGTKITLSNVLKNRSIVKGFDIVNVHTSSPKMALYWKTAAPKKVLITWPAFRKWSRTDRIIQHLTDNTAVTNSVADKLPGKPEITPYSVDTENYNASRTPGNKSKLKICFIGKPSSGRGFDHLCKALQKVECEFELNYALAKNRGDIEEAENKVEGYGIRDQTEMYHGFVEDLPKYLNDNDVFVNLVESSQGITAPPILTLEAMSCGRATISSKDPVFRELVKDGENGFLEEYNDYEEIAERLGELNENRESIRQIGEEARKMIIEKHSKKVSADKFEKAYEKRL